MNLIPESVANSLSARLKGLSGRRKDDLIPRQANQEAVMRYTFRIFDQRVAVCQTARDGYDDADTTDSSAQKLSLFRSDILHVIIFYSGISERSMLGGLYRLDNLTMT